MGGDILSIFDFILIKLAKEYVTKQGKKFSTLTELFTEFNKSNNFSRIKLNLYPYIITMGNGNREKLFDALGADFYYTPYGMLHRKFSTISLLNISNNNQIDFNTETDGCAIILKNNLIDNLIDDKELINNLANNNSNLSNILTCIYKSIESIDVKYPNDNFITGETEELKKFNRAQYSFNRLETIFKNLDNFDKRKAEEVKFNKRIPHEHSSLASIESY